MSKSALEGRASTPSCELCDALSGSLRPIQKMEVSTAFLYVDQSYPYRAIVVLERHVEDILSLPTQMRVAFHEDAITLARVLREVSGAVTINLALLGNRTPHLHWHLIPRSPTDSNWGGAPWPHAVRHVSDDVYRTRSAELSAALQRVER